MDLVHSFIRLLIQHLQFCVDTRLLGKQGRSPVEMKPAEETVYGVSSVPRGGAAGPEEQPLLGGGWGWPHRGGEVCAESRSTAGSLTDGE